MGPMIERSGDPPQAPMPARDSDVSQAEAGFMDAIRFLYERRVQLGLRVIALFGIGVIGLVYWYTSAPKLVEGTVGLTFQGIERHEYPTGRKFSVEDFRGPDLLIRSLADAGMQSIGADLKELAAHVFVTPLVPADIQGRWRKQEKDGARKDDYFPNEFKIAIGGDGLSDSQRVRFFDALVRHYQAQVKYLQKSALTLVSPNDWSYEKLAAAYDFWDLPVLFNATYTALSAGLNHLLQESLRYSDLKYHVALRTISADAEIWYGTRLQAFEALTYQGRLVKNRDAIMQRVQYRIDEIDIRIQQKTREADEQSRLLAVIDRPKALVAGQFGQEKGLAMLDASTLEKLIQSDYIGPVVARISKLQEEKQTLTAEKSRLQRQLVWLPKAGNIGVKDLPAGYRDVVQAVSSELREIVQAYNKVLDEYLTALVSSHITIKRSPIITREGYSPKIILAAILLLSLFLAIVLMSIEHLYRRARDEARTARQAVAAAK
jgi:hypothetical protein